MLSKHFLTLNICIATQFDQVLADFLTFYQNELKYAKLNGSKFEKDKYRLDDIYVKELCVLPYKQLSFVIEIILTISHGEAAVDRGFYINISALKTNISPECVIAKRLVKNHLLENNLKPHTIQITNATVRAFKGARLMQPISMMRTRKRYKQEKVQHITWELTRRLLQWWRTNTLNAWNLT